MSAAFISLLDNYESDTGKPEIVTPEEVAENHKFLDSIIKTPTMKVAVVAGVGNEPHAVSQVHTHMQTRKGQVLNEARAMKKTLNAPKLVRQITWITGV